MEDEMSSTGILSQIEVKFGGRDTMYAPTATLVLAAGAVRLGAVRESVNVTTSRSPTSVSLLSETTPSLLSSSSFSQRWEVTHSSRVCAAMFCESLPQS